MQYVLYGSIILYLGRDLFIPLSFAALVSFILYPFCAWLERKKVGRMTAIVIGLLLMLVLISLIFFLLAQQFSLFLKEWPTIKIKIQDLINQTTQTVIQNYSLTEVQQEKWSDELGGRIVNFLANGILSIISASVYSSVMFIMIPIFAGLILFYRHRLIEIVLYLFPQEKKDDVRKIALLTIDAYYNFIKGMAIVYLAVGVLNSVGLLIIGVPHAIFFGFIASVLTFIPYLGIMAGSLLPVTMAWITFNSVWYPIAVIAVFTIVQYLEANVIFPVAVSNRLNMNTLATLIAIVTGGILWGVSGMILFVPFAGILKLISDQHPKMKIWKLMIGR